MQFSRKPLSRADANAASKTDSGRQRWVRTHACKTVAGRASDPVAVYCGKMVHKVRVFKSHWHLPRSKPIRIGLGILLVAVGLLGFLPVLGFWMIPIGLLVLSVDLPVVRRWRRKLTVWWHRRNEDL